MAIFSEQKGGDTTKSKSVNILLYDNIVKIAKTKGLSINAVEKKALISAGSLCKWNYVSPTLKNLIAVADVLGCTVDELITEASKE